MDENTVEKTTTEETTVSVPQEPKEVTTTEVVKETPKTVEETTTETTEKSN